MERGRLRVLAKRRLEPQVIEARRPQVHGQTVQAVDDGIGPLHELRHPSADSPTLVDLPLQQAESEAQRCQGLPRLVVKLPGNVAPLALLRCDEAARKGLHPHRRCLHLLEEHRVLDGHRGLGRHRLGQPHVLFVEVAGLALGQREEPGHVAASDQRDPHPARLG